MARLFHWQRHRQRGHGIMKTKILVALIAITSVAILTSCRPRTSGQIAANWLPVSHFRVVQGQLYDSVHSELWGNPVELAGFHSHANENSRLLTYLAKVEIVGRDKIQCGVYQQAHWPPVANGEVESADMVQEIVIYHYPNAESLISGQALGDCQCMRVGNYNDHGISYAAFDCGVPSTELVPMINGKRVKIDGVQVLLVNANQADDFVKTKKIESDQKYVQTKADIEKLKSELSTNQFNYEVERNVPSNFIENDPQYIEAMKKYNNVKTRSTKKFNDTIRYYPSGMPNLASAELTEELEEAGKELEGIPSKIRAERSARFEAASRALEATKQKLNVANQSLESCQSPSFYLSDFSPAALEMAQTDAKGKFVIHNSKAGTKVFAKVKSDETGEVFFWLLNSPQNGERLILSDKNLFTPPTDTP